MVNPNNNVVAFLTQNQKLYVGLQAALKRMVVIKAENIEAVNNTVKYNAVAAVVLHVTNSSGWIIFELLKTGYPDLPRYAVLAPSLSGKENVNTLINRYGAAGIIDEKTGIKALAPLIEGETEAEENDTSSTKEKYLNVFGDVARELLRLQGECNITGMRTLPQPEIGRDTQNRLQKVLNKLQGIKIQP